MNWHANMRWSIGFPSRDLRILTTEAGQKDHEPWEACVRAVSQRPAMSRDCLGKQKGECRQLCPDQSDHSA